MRGLPARPTVAWPLLATVVALALLWQLRQPLLQRWPVRLPPAMTVGSVVVIGAPFGLPGIVFGTPPAIAVMVLVKKLYTEPMAERRP